MGLSAKKEKDDRFQQIKKDVVEMIKIEAPSMESEVYFSLICYFIQYQIFLNWFEFVNIYANSMLNNAAYLIWFIVTFS